MAIKSVGVLGCGLMGSGIAQVCAAAGYKTTVREVSQILLEKGIGRIQKFVEDGVAKGKVTADARDETLGNLSGTTTFAGLKDCDLIIEAIVENLDDKKQTYQALEKIVKKETIFLSNTSSLCITELAAATERPDRFGGLHFFNPVPLMKLVEVIRALTTSDETYQTVFAFAQSLGKEPTVSARCNPGVRARPPIARGHRQGHEARMRLPDGAVHAARLRGPRHDVLHREHHVRRVS